MPDRDVKLAPKWRILLRKVQRGAFSKDELVWMLATHADAPVLVQFELRRKLNALTDEARHTD